jgi:hypothetical protein
MDNTIKHNKRVGLLTLGFLQPTYLTLQLILDIINSMGFNLSTTCTRILLYLLQTLLLPSFSFPTRILLGARGGAVG